MYLKKKIWKHHVCQPFIFYILYFMGLCSLNAERVEISNPALFSYIFFFFIIYTPPRSLFLLSFFVGPSQPLSLSISDSLLIISPSPFFFGFHTNSLSIFKCSSCHLFLSSIYTSACLDLGVSKLVTPHFCTLPTFLYYSLHSNNN